MTWLFFGIAIGMVIKVLVPWPSADDKIRALWAKYITKAPTP